MANNFAEKSVIIADNSSVMTRIIQNHLVKMGFSKDNLVTCSDGHQTHLIIGLKDFDLAITGYHMELVNGLQLLKKLRNDSKDKIKNLFHLVITAERKEELLNELMDEGCSGYLNKPFTYNQLEKKIHQLFPENEEEETASDQSPSPIAIDSKVTAAFIDSAIESLGQYMVSAMAEDPIDAISGDFYFGSLVELKDESDKLQINIILYFPKDVACSIYEAIFGEVDLEQVCGVVQELGNIIGGIVKPKISEMSQEILPLVNLKVDEPKNLDFELGLPQAKMGEDCQFEVNGNGDSAQVIIPLEVNEDTALMQLQFKKMG